MIHNIGEFSNDTFYAKYINLQHTPQFNSEMSYEVSIMSILDQIDNFMRALAAL